MGRTVGRRALVAAIGERENASLTGVYGQLPVGHWRVDEAALVLLLAESAETMKSPFSTLFSFYDSGDTGTRVAALRALNFVTDDNVSAGLDLVHDAGRTYLQELMEAAWCNNPFSNQNLSNTEYRKAFLKALFCDVPVDGFMDLEKRADSEMAASLHDFADEREAAGRSVPDAVWVVAALHPQPGLIARLIGRLEHPMPAMRRTAVQALRNAQDPRTVSFMEERLGREDNPEISSLIQRTLASFNGDQIQ